MINLIPNEEKKKKVKDFYFRLAVIVLMLIGFAMTVGAVAIMPAYFFSSVKKNLYADKLESEKQEVVALFNQETLNIVNDLKGKLGLIEQTSKEPYLVSEKVINEVLRNKMSDIKIDSISYDNTAAKGKVVTISGTAGSRERLLLFKKALEGGSAFKEVNLPISNFVKGTNINFTMTLVPV